LVLILLLMCILLFLLHPPLLLLLLLLLHALPSLRKITATAVTKTSSALPEMPTTCLPLSAIQC